MADVGTNIYGAWYAMAGEKKEKYHCVLGHRQSHIQRRCTKKGHEEVGSKQQGCVCGVGTKGPHLIDDKMFVF